MTAQRKRWSAAIAVTMTLLLTLAATAIAASPPMGSYSRTITGAGKQLNGPWVIAFKAGGHYTVAWKDRVIGKGKITVTGTKATLIDSACKPSQTGKYTYTVKGAVLTFKRLSDPCPGRSAVLAKPLHSGM
jgi:hypothetical protein